MDKTFFMVRHGETLANKQGVAAGIFDTPLTERGRQQAANLEESLHQSNVRFDYIVHSGLSRAIDTAITLNKRLGLPLIENKDIAEQNFGDWQGKEWKQIMSLIRAGHIPPNGESLENFYNRVTQGIKNAIHNMNGVPLLVTHGGVFDAFFSCYKLAEIDVENCALYKLSLREEAGIMTGSAEKALS